MDKSGKESVKIGDRVGCFLSVVHGTGLLLGYGTYVGNEVPPNEGHTSLTAYLSGERRANPKIVLDSGEVVWGCECWWGPEDEIKEECAKLQRVIPVTMTEARMGKVPAGFDGYGAPEGPSSNDDFFGSRGGGGGGDFWS